MLALEYYFLQDEKILHAGDVSDAFDEFPNWRLIVRS